MGLLERQTIEPANANAGSGGFSVARLWVVPLCFAFLSLSSCTVDLAKREAKPPLCKGKTYCTLSGRLSIEMVGHVEMGRLDLQDGTCLNISFSPKKIETLLGETPRNATISGIPFNMIPDENVAAVEVMGRRIGFPQCNNFYIFVK
jgi:hypothetical protein